MTKKIIALFASSFLMVSMTIPAVAEEATGTIQKIDENSSTITLDDGNTYVLPGEFDYQSIQPGMEVHVIYDEADKKRVVTDIDMEE